MNMRLCFFLQIVCFPRGFASIGFRCDGGNGQETEGSAKKCNISTTKNSSLKPRMRGKQGPAYLGNYQKCGVNQIAQAESNCDKTHKTYWTYAPYRYQKIWEF